MSHVQPRRARADDLPAIGRTIARAFDEDPAFVWAAPSPARRRRHGARYFEFIVRNMYFPKGETYVIEGVRGVAVWAPPDRWQVPSRVALRFIPATVLACGLASPRAFSMPRALERLHETLPAHYYLPLVAVDPADQGRGLGSGLLDHMLRRCDVESTAAYLEATSVRSRLLYERHGFEVIDELRWPGDGPAVWPMWRPPGRA